MKSRGFLTLSIVLALVPGPVPLAAVSAQEQEPPASPVELPTFGVGTSAVTLDVVVRDKKGRAVRDLKASDFEIFEDGAKQAVESFEVFGRPLDEGADGERKAPAPSASVAAPAAIVAAAPDPAPSPEAPPGIETRPLVIAFVFDRLSAEARNIAHKAARSYLDQGHIEGDLVGIFTIDLALRTILPFTKDVSLVRGGLERAASQGNTAFGDMRAQRRDLVDQVTAGQRVADTTTGANPGQGGGGDANAAAGAAAQAQAVANLQAGMLRNFEALERDQQGYASTNGLLAVVSGLKNLPGRKTVIFFSEGLAIPPNVQAKFREVIANANVSNVSVYTMDAAGLRAQSMYEETRKEILQNNERRLRQLESGRDDAESGPATRGMERNEDLLRLHPEAGLGQLAAETGGFMIRDTNDASEAFKRIEEDMRFHYLLGYSPSNENYDGRFRVLSVRVKRPGVQVQTRQGYVAVRAVESTPLKTFEAPVLARLDKKMQPHDFPIQATALSFPSPARPGLAPVLVRVPGTTIAYALDKEDKSGKKLHRADFAIVVRVKNESGVEVDRLSQHYLLAAAAEDLPRATKGDLLFYREAELSPGRYTFEAVGFDAVSSKMSVTTTSLEVPQTVDGRPRLSSVILVGRAEPAGGEDGKDNPLFYGETIIYPNMGDPFKKSTNPALGFFFTVYGVGEQVHPKATIQVLKGDQPAGQVTAELPAADAAGRVQYAGALPLQSFAPGSYTLKVTATTATGNDSRLAAFTITE